MADASPQNPRTPETVEREIAQTRAELDETLDVLAHRLSPEEIKDRAVGYAKDKAASVGVAVKRNPVPTALVVGALAAGLVWVNRRDARRLRDREDMARALWQRLAATALAERADGLSRARAAAAGAVDRLGSLALGARDTLAHAAGDAAERTRDLVASDAVRPAVDSARRMVAALEDRSRQQPLVAIGAGIVCGALLARLLRR